MNDNFLRLVFCAIFLVLGAGLEELLPKWLGVGFPILLLAVQTVAARHGLSAAVTIFAISAGAMEDALSALPTMTSVSYFLIIMAFSPWTGSGRIAASLACMGYQAWLAVWSNGLGGSVFLRFILVVPIGLMTAAAVRAVLGWATRKVAIDEHG